MKTDTQTNSVKSTIFANAHAMQFDPEGTAHLMSILSNIYSNAPLAVVREYSSNARDSHIEANNPAPIEVHLPNEWDQNFVVKDYGVGLDEDGIINVYSHYGKSTRRHSNEAIGGFGIGSKAAFTITSQFVVTGIKNGVKTEALFALNEQNIGTVSILSRGDTTEPNGVTVSIGVDDCESIKKAAETLFSTWDKGTVLVDGLPPKTIWNDYINVTDTLYANYNNGGLSVVMGGIRYQVNDDILRKILRRTSARDLGYTVAYNCIYKGLTIIKLIPVGSVDITPSREDLRDTEKTLDTLTAALQEYSLNIKNRVQSEIQSATSPIEAVAKLYDYRNFLDNKLNEGIVWQGKKLPYSVDTKFVSVLKSKSRNGRPSAKIHYNTNFVLGQDLSGLVAITGVTEKNYEGIRRNAGSYMSENNIQQMVLVPNYYGNVEWFSYGTNSIIKTVSLSEFRAAVRKVAPKRATNETVYNTSLGFLTASEIVSKNQKVLVLDSESTIQSGNVIFNEAFANWIVVTLEGRQSMNAFKNRVPGSVSDYSYIYEAKAKEIIDGLSDDIRELLSFCPSTNLGYLAQVIALGGNIISIPELDRYTNLFEKYSKINLQNLSKYQRAERILGVTRNNAAENRKLEESLLTRFPLLSYILETWGRSYHIDKKQVALHASLYIQSVLQYENQ